MKQHDAIAKIKTENFAEIWVVIFFKKKFFFADVLASNEQLSKKKFWKKISIFFSKKIQKFRHKICLGPGFFMNFFFKTASFLRRISWLVYHKWNIDDNLLKNITQQHIYSSKTPERSIFAMASCCFKKNRFFFYFFSLFMPKRTVLDPCESDPATSPHYERA